MKNSEYTRLIEELKDSKVSWKKFKSKLDVLNQLQKYLNNQQEKSPSHLKHKWSPIYRGQKDFSWTLKTTLERSPFSASLSLNRYHALAIKARELYSKLIEDPVLDPKKIHQYPYENGVQDSISFLLSGNNLINKVPDCLRFWLFLRHYGFPSPFLDWSKNPLIAAFFAFHKPSAAEFVSVHVLLQGSSGSSGANLIVVDDTSGDDSDIWLRRHKEQESVYTLFYREYNNRTREKISVFESHEEMLKQNSAIPYPSEIVFKFEIPAKERMKVLQDLDSDGINAAKLLADTDARLETVHNKLAFMEK